jgi:hypothetical protein
MEIKVESGKVLSFDSTTSCGKVSLQSGGEVVFHSTSFQSGSPTRFPRHGEAVKVTFDEDRVVSIRSA